MPVLGHAVAGWITAIWTETRYPSDSSGSWSWVLRLPCLVSVSYAPDLAAVAGDLIGWHDAARHTHSIGFALAIGMSFVFVSPVLAFSRRSGFLMGIGLVLLHDVMDLTQGAGRSLAWPISSQAVGPSTPWLPRNVAAEFVVLGLLLIFVVGAAAFLRSRSGGLRVKTCWCPGGRFACLLTGVLVVVAVATQSLRDKREAQFAQAVGMLRGGEYHRALQLLEDAEKWPSPIAPGRTDYHRGEALAELGNWRDAEHSFLQASAKDPGFFWAVSDLAILYAKASDLPRQERVRRLTPLLRRLQVDFSAEPALSETLARVNRLLMESQ